MNGVVRYVAVYTEFRKKTVINFFVLGGEHLLKLQGCPAGQLIQSNDLYIVQPVACTEA